MKTERLFNFMYAVGAAVVIMGAWMKITHRELADTFLTIGLLTEALMFILTAVQELKNKPVNNSVTYPQIDTVDNSELTESINQLNKTIKQVFNR